MCRCKGKCTCKSYSAPLASWWLVLLCPLGRVVPVKDKESLDKVFDRLMLRDWKSYKPSPM